MKLVPQNLLSAASVIVILVVTSAVLLALKAPLLGIQLEADNEEGLRVVSVSKDSPNLTQIAAGSRITFLHDIMLDGDLLVEEPDQLEQWTRYNGLIDKLNRLYSALDNESVLAVVDGEPVQLNTRKRQLTDLPFLFWFQLIIGSAGFLTAAGVFAYRPRNRAALHFLLAGTGLLTFSCAAAVYSTRELVMSGTLMQTLSIVNQFGAVFFTAALVALLWEHPRRLNDWLPIVPLSYGAGVVIWVGFAFQLYPVISLVYIFTLLLFAVSFLFAFLQWQRTRGRPTDRAALKWYLLSIYIGTGFFAVLILIPVALSVDPPASQGLMFALFLFMFIGIALGITRYRLFDLDRWWFSAWLWFLGGLAVIALDIVLVVFLNFSQVGALTLALALLGWVYFPVRQWAWSLFMHGRRGSAGGQHWLRELSIASDKASLNIRWHSVLQKEFSPLQMIHTQNVADGVSVAEDGVTIILPDLAGQGSLQLSHPGSGSRLFGRDDIERANLLLNMANIIRDAMTERSQLLFNERQRIRRDLHDDLGAKLLTLVYQTEGETQTLARSAIQDIRQILAALDAEPLSLDELTAGWRAEAQERAETHGFSLNWNVDKSDLLMNSRLHSNLTRILREAISNAVRHAAAIRISVTLTLNDGILRLAVEDTSAVLPVSDPAQWPAGFGTRMIRHRSADLGGKAQWYTTTTGNQLLIEVPLNN